MVGEVKIAHVIGSGFIKEIINGKVNAPVPKNYLIGGDFIVNDVVFKKNELGNVFCIHDSGGFQVQSGRIKLHDYESYLDRLLWRYTNMEMDIGIALDIPIIKTVIGSDGFPKASIDVKPEDFEKNLEQTVKNTLYMEQHRTGNYKLYHTLHGRTTEERERWLNAHKAVLDRADGYACSPEQAGRLKMSLGKKPAIDRLLDLLEFAYKNIDTDIHIFLATGIYDLIALNYFAGHYNHLITTDSASANLFIAYGEIFLPGFETAIVGKVKSEKYGGGRRHCIKSFPCYCPACVYLSDNDLLPPFEKISGDVSMYLTLHNSYILDNFVTMLRNLRKSKDTYIEHLSRSYPLTQYIVEKIDGFVTGKRKHSTLEDWAK